MSNILQVKSRFGTNTFEISSKPTDLRRSAYWMFIMRRRRNKHISGRILGKQQSDDYRKAISEVMWAIDQFTSPA